MLPCGIFELSIFEKKKNFWPKKNWKSFICNQNLTFNKMNKKTILYKKISSIINAN